MAKNPLQAQPNLQELLLQLGSAKVTLSQAKYGSKKYKDLLKQVQSLQSSVDAALQTQERVKVERSKAQERITVSQLQEEKQRAIDLGDTARVQQLDQQLAKVTPQPIPAGTFTPSDNAKVKPVGTAPVPSLEKVAEKPSQQPESMSSQLKKAGKTAKETADQTAKKNLTIDEIYNLATQEFGAIDLIFKQDKDLQKILTQAVNEKWTNEKFANAVQNSTWFKSKAPELQRREFNKRQYRDLLQQPNADKQALYQNTEYGRGLARTIQMVKDNAIATGAAIDEATAEVIAQDLYDSANETDPYSVRNQIRARIAYKPGIIMGGEAGKDLRDLQNTARANGLDLDKQFGNSIQGWLQRLNQGESIETFKQLIRNTAKVGLPDKVSALIDQGVDLNTIYSPYKNMMAATLEVNPDTIQLNDPTLRMAIGPDKEMSLYDYQRSLRKDPRWQYTNNARSDVSKAALQVLKDFGFQG